MEQFFDKSDDTGYNLHAEGEVNYKQMVKGFPIQRWEGVTT
jgi:hypothetical protein